MTWLQRYRIRHWLRNSIWISPVIAMVMALVAVRLLIWIDVSMGWQANLNPETTRAVIGSLASAQFTPRVIGNMFRDRVTKLTLAVFVFTFTFDLAALLRIDVTVPFLVTQIAVYGCAVSVGAFLFMVDHVGKMLRPNGVFESIASQAHDVINSVYPRRLSDA